MMKAPFILSVDFARNSLKPESEVNWPQWIIPLVSNKHLIAISQDPLSMQVIILDSLFSASLVFECVFWVLL